VLPGAAGVDDDAADSGRPEESIALRAESFGTPPADPVEGIVEEADFWSGPDGFTPITGFAGGKRSCEIAITISDRKRARKKRLSIYGTGS
jgi:hypothetical protein